MNYLIVAAGGSGERMKSKDNKILLKINDKEIIYWTLRAFEESPVINGVVISGRIEDQKIIKEIIAENKFNKVMAVVNSGKTRQDTVFNALTWLKNKAKKNDLIGIHNAANPFIMKKEIEDVFLEASKHRAALLAYPARDTIKIVDKNNLVDHTPTRISCWCAQTPQVAFYGDLLNAFAMAQVNNFVGTDDAQLLELIGVRPKVVACSNRNFKITFPEDLIIAKEILPIFIKENK